MSYKLELTLNAEKDIKYLKKSGDKVTLRKLNKLFEELTEHPRTGTWQPKEPKYNYSGCWSRKINKKDRLVYRIEDEIVTVVILQTLGHYRDK